MKRWTPQRKMIVVKLVHGGVISKEHAIADYGLSSEELDSWLRNAPRGIKALKVTG